MISLVKIAVCAMVMLSAQFGILNLTDKAVSMAEQVSAQPCSIPQLSQTLYFDCKK